MRNSKLKEEYMKEESFWHVTNKKNLKSIREVIRFRNERMGF